MPGALAAFERLVAKRKSAVWITGNKVHFNSDSGIISSVHWGPHCQPPIARGRRAFSAVFGPTAFWRRSLYYEVGPIDEAMHYAMDTEYWARFTIMGIRQTRLNHFCWAFRNHETSKTQGAQSEMVAVKRSKETSYWRRKLRYDFKVTPFNIWYVYWCLWRIVDGSWIMRAWLKRRYEGSLITKMVHDQSI